MDERIQEVLGEEKGDEEKEKRKREGDKEGRGERGDSGREEELPEEGEG
jgi:hypothetical protein